MIDREARDQYAELLRHFVAGVVTNDEYEISASRILARSRRRDDTLFAIYSKAWFMYDDIRTHRMRGQWRLPKEGRREVARWILFLHSSLEYEWPVKSFISLSGCLLGIVTLGLAHRIMGPSIERRMHALGSWDRWPFFREDEFDHALKNPKYLTGRS